MLHHRALEPLLFRFLGMSEVLNKHNAQAALLLLQNMSCDRVCRHALVKAGAVQLLLQLLAANPLALKQQQPKEAAYLTGTLLNLVVADGDDGAGGEASPARSTFVKAGGLEKGCQVGSSCSALGQRAIVALSVLSWRVWLIAKAAVALA